MAPPGIVGRSKGLYPQKPQSGSSQMDQWRTNRLKSRRDPGMTSLQLALQPGDYSQMFMTEPLRSASPLSGPVMRFGRPSAMVRNPAGELMFPNIPPGTPPIEQMIFRANQADATTNVAGAQTASPLNRQGPLQRFGQEGLSPLFNVPPQSPYRPGSAPGMSVLGGGEMATQDSIQATIDQIRFDRENLRDMRMRQGELKQGQFDTNWQEYARQAPLMNQYQSPQFAQTNQGLGPGGVSPLSAEEGQYWRGRNAYPSQPGTEQMYDRFGPGSPLTASGRAGSLTADPRALSREEWGASVARNQQAMQQAEMQQRAGLLDSEGMLNRTYEGPYTRRDRDGDIAYTSREQALRDAGQDSTADQVAAARQAKFDAFNQRRRDLGLRTRDDIAGRRADRDMERAETLQNRQAQNLSRRGISPLSPEGQSLAPDLYTSIQNRRRGGAAGVGSPLTLTQPDGTAVPVTPVPQNQTSRTPQVQGQANEAIKALQQRPIFAHLGLADAESSPTGYDMAEAVDTQIVRQGMDLSPEELADLHQWAVQASKTATNDFDPFNTPSIWNKGTHERSQKRWGDLARIPLQDKQAVAKWWEEYKREGKISAGGASAAARPPATLSSPLRTGGY